MAINWNFDADVPTDDFFETFDLDDPGDVSEALDNFFAEMASDRFRTWEAIIRQEQGLPCTTFLDDLADRLLNFADEDDRVLYIDEIPRGSEPWYEILRKIAPRLVLEPFRTSDAHYDGFTDAWPSLVAVIENHGRGLSLPDGVSEPLDVLPAELRHKLWLQSCFDALSGLGQDDDLTLAEEDQLDRIDLLINQLGEHRESVEFFGLTLAGLLQRVVLPERDRPIFVRLMCEKLGLDGPDAPLAPHLHDRPTVPSEPAERLPDETIKQAIVHPDPAVREMAADYFADGFSPDPTIAPLVIQAVEQYGRDDAFPTYWFLHKLAHTQQTVAWMVRRLQEIGDPDDDASDYCMSLFYALSVVDPDLLQPYRREIEDLRRIAPVVPGMTLGRVEYQRFSPEELWKRFEKFVADPFDDYPVFPETEVLRDIAALLGQDERMVCWVLETLARKVDDPQYNVWREGVAVQLAGELRLSAAVPYLVPLLHDDEDDLNDDAMESLSRIGTDEVTARLDRRYLAAGEGFRRRAAGVLEDIHTEQSIATLRFWHKYEVNDTVRQRILRSLLCGFVPAAIEPACNELASADSLTSDVRNLRIELVALCTLTGADFPELKTWKEEARQDYLDDSWGDDEEDEWDEWGDDAWHAKEWDDEDEWDDASDVYSGWIGSGATGFGADASERAERTKPIINTGPRIGRNDPCPCGSGKKYKKCCMRKES